MAEATGLRNSALPYPVYGVPFGITFPLLDADGDPISPSSPDSERSLNGDTFADCTNEATEIATSSGICYLLLTAAEMTADVVTVRIQSTGAKTTVMTLYPRKLVTLRSGTCQGSNDAGDIQLDSGASAVDDYYNGCLVVATIDTVVEARIINDYVGSTKVAEVSPAFATAQPDSNDTFVIYLPEGRQITQSDGVAWLGTAAATPTVAGVPEVDITHISGSAVSTSTAQLGVNAVQAGGTAWGSGAITAASIATGAIDADALAADASTEINTAVLAVLGALNDAAADGAVTTTDTMVAYLKQIINTLEGAPGIPTWPAAAAPGNAVSIAEAVRYIYDQIGVAGAGLTAADDATITAISGLDTKLDTIDNFLDTEIATLITMLTGIVPLNGTIGATGNTTTALHLDGIAWADDGPNSMLLTIKDVSTGLFYSRWIEDFATAGDLATVATLPFTPEASVDLYWLTPVRADVTGGSGLDAAGVRAAIGLASANLDTQLDAIPTAAEVWSAGTRTLTALDEDSTTLDLNATILAAVGLASANLDTQLADIEGKVDDLETRLGTPSDLGSGATVAANLVDIEGQTDDIGAAGAGLTAIPWNAAWDAEVQSEVTDGLNAYDPPTHGELTTALGTADDAVLAAIAALNNLSAAQAASAVGAIVIEGAVTLIESLRLANSANAGKLSGAATTTVRLRNLADSLDRITATVDADGNRSAVTLDLS